MTCQLRAGVRGHENLGYLMQGTKIWGLTMRGSRVMLDARPHAWMEAGNLLTSLASLFPQNTLRELVPFCPRRLLFASAVSMSGTPL